LKPAYSQKETGRRRGDAFCLALYRPQVCLVKESAAKGFNPYPTTTGGRAKMGVAKAKHLASRYARARKGGESNTLAATESRNSTELPTTPSGISLSSSRNSIGLENAARFPSLVSRRRRKRQRCGSGPKYEILCPWIGGSSSEIECFQLFDPGYD